MAKSMKISSKEQHERLVDIMESSPDVARGKGQFGSSQQQTKGMWEKNATVLNALGPPIRTGAEWSRVWTHYKYNLKKKVTHNKENLKATGGGKSQEISLSTNEERVYDLLNINTSINPVGESFGVDDSEDENPPIEAPLPRASSSLLTSRKRKHKMANNDDIRIKMLREQTDAQKEIISLKKEKLNTLKQIEQTVHKTYQIIKNQHDISEKELKQKQELREIKLHIAKIKLAQLSCDLNL